MTEFVKIVEKRRYYFDIQQSFRATAALAEIITERCPADRVWVLERVAVVNETSNYTTLTLLKRSVGFDHLVEEQLNPVLGILYWTADPIVVLSNQELVASCAGCAPGDVIWLYATGYEELEAEVE